MNSLDDRLVLVLAQQAVVDQDARELRADGLGQQRGDDRRIDAAGQAADHAVVADALANRGDRSRRRNRPAARCPRQPQTVVRKLPRILLPSGVCVTSG